MKKWYIASIIIIIAGIVIWFTSRPGDAKEEQTAFFPQVEKVQRGSIRVQVSTTGTIEPINKVEIKSKASGLIEEMTIEESDHVNKGDLIAKLDQRDTKNSYDQSVAELHVAKASLKQSESDFKRKQDLYKKGLIPAVEFDQAELALVQAKAQVVRAQVSLDNNDIRLKDTIVRSPISGIILTKDVEEGQIISSGISSVSGGTLIATVADMRQVYVKADVDEVDIGKIEPGMTAHIVADAYPNEQFTGKVIRIAAQAKVEQNVTSFEVTIQVDNPTGKLKAGMNVSVEILIADKQDVLLVPNEALMTQAEMTREIASLKMAMGESEKPNKTGSGQQGRPDTQRKKPEQNNSGQTSGLNRGVIVKQGNDFRPQLVKVGVSNFDNTEILEGLQEGQQVVYTFFSRAKASSDQFRKRIMSRMSMSSGLKKRKSK
ncbi:MAG: efflux RND transporter periplasmic adaptor subunit [Actinobacteria bacterium]|nr:efflux RND transporter periplasmic adaptor subunit [Actinomycetota bacterium]